MYFITPETLSVWTATVGTNIYVRPPCTTAVGGLGICKFMEVPFVNTPFPFEALPHQSALQWWVSQGASIEGHAPRWFHPQHWGAPLFLPLPMLFFSCCYLSVGHAIAQGHLTYHRFKTKLIIFTPPWPVYH